MPPKKPKGAPPNPKPAPRFRVCAVHEDVAERLAGWLTEPSWCNAASDFQAMLDLVEEGDLEAAEVLLRSQSRDVVGDGVCEYGKNQKGGTLRLFLLREHDSYFFLAAGLKKSNDGAVEIKPACARARAIKKMGKQSNLSDYKAQLGDKFRVTVIRTPPGNTQ